MRVLLLSPIADRLIPALSASGDEYVIKINEIDPQDFLQIDYTVSFGYRHIIKSPILDIIAGSNCNIHISMLPWNRGADPNFWSWFDDTPKGVSIHQMGAGIDTGPIFIQREINLPDTMTLRSSYERLIEAGFDLFSEAWPKLRINSLQAHQQRTGGSHHRKADKDLWMTMLPLGWDSPVGEISELGTNAALNARYHDRMMAE